METLTPTTVTVAIVNGHRLTDDGLRRVSAECTSVVSLATEERSFADVAARWEALAPGLAIEDGGRVGTIRDAIIECARRGVMVIATPAPRKADRFVAECLQGAAAATEFDVPGIAVHVVRDQPRPGSVAWLSDTGELSGYGVLFAVGYAAAHGVGVELIEPTGGLDKARTPGAMDEALAFAAAAGVPITRHTDPSPFARVLRDEHSLVVHPVLDAAQGFNLLHPGELSHKAVATGSPAVVVELIERFPADVVAVFDAVHLLGGSIPAARIAAGVALGVVAAAGIGTVVASPAMATAISESAQTGVVATVTGQNGMGHEGIVRVENMLDHAVTVDLKVTWVATSTHGKDGHGGHGKNENHPDLYTEVNDVVVQPGQLRVVEISRPSGLGQGSYHPGQVESAITRHHQELVTTTTPEKEPGPIVVTGTVETFSELRPDAPIVAVPENMEMELQAIAPPHIDAPTPQATVTQTPPYTIHAPEVQPPLVLVPVVVPDQVTPTQGPVVEPTLEASVLVPVVVPDQVTPQVDVLTPTVGLVTETPGGAQTPVADLGGVTVELQQQVTPQVDVITPTVGLVTETPGGAQTPVADLGGVTVELQQQVTPQVDVITPTVGVVTQTPDPLLDVGGAGVTSEVITDVTMPPEIATPGIPDTIKTGGLGPSTPMTHHQHTTPSGLDGGAGSNDHWAPEGELAHTGGNAAILAIVAGSLVAAGAGLAVAGRMGKYEEDHDTPDG